MKKFYALIFFLTMCVSGIYAQAYGTDPCASSPPSCIINGDLAVTNTGGNVNTSGVPGSIMNGWYVSHGTPSIYNANAPGSTGRAIWMWNYSAQGEGMFTCFDFKQGHTYKVCVCVKNTNLINLGKLQVWASTGLLSYNPPSCCGDPLPSFTSRELIDSSFSNDTAWDCLSFSYTPSANFTQLWLFPWMNHGPVGGHQYELVIDKIRVTEVYRNATIRASKDTLINCNDSSILSVLGVPASTTITWSPATGLSSSTGNPVIAKPSTTTTYTATIGDPNCPTCGDPQTLTYTIYVTGCCAHADFGYKGCNPVQFLDASSGTGTAIGWSWDFGDGTSSSLPNPLHSYTAAGTYTVCLTVIMKNGDQTCCDRICKEVKVCKDQGLCQAHADFNASQLTSADYTVSFTDWSSGTGIPCGWHWDFGDGSVSNLQNPTHTYSGAGTYTVCLNVVICMYDANGVLIKQCENRICKDIVVSDPTSKPMLKIFDSGSGNINIQEDPFKVLVSPNPAGNNVRIEVQGITNPMVTIKTITGDEIGTAVMTGRNVFNFNATSLKPGAYIVQVKGTNSGKTVKFVKE